MKKRYSLLSLALSLILISTILGACSNQRPGKPRVLVYIKTAGYHHQSIPDGVKAIKKLGAEHGFDVEATADDSKFTEDTLKTYSAVVFLSTTHKVLNYIERADFQRYIEAGGGYVGIHAAADCEYHWPWYGKLVGAYFKSHPEIQKATLDVHKDPNFPVTDSLPSKWVRTDEWYNFRKVPQNVHVLVSIDESSYKGGENGSNHPMVWYHNYDGGRAFYMELGHTKESYTEPDYLKLLLAGIQYAIGNNDKLDYSKATALRVPAEDRFSKKLLAGPLNEPTEFTILPDLSILIGQRKGGIEFYNHATKKMTEVAHLNVYHHTNKPNTNVEMGLMGIHADPHYATNHWVYVYYSPMDKSVDRLSRFKFQNNKFDLKSEQIILEVPTERAMCCHTGGSIAFNAQGDLFLSVGDNTTPFDEINPKTGKAYPLNTHGYAPLDDRPGFDHFDDRRSAGNSNDLRGKILRIKVNPDGTYSIPPGNLFPKGTPKTRPEIYVMGDRNPYRIAVDQHTGYLYWGEVGPDADNDSMATRGPRGYDEFNQARKAGNFGWPYFVGNNYPYREYNYATGKSGRAFNPAHPVNDSRNNTGLKVLPPAQPAFIWYPYAVSPQFPILGQGGRCSIAGPIYYANDYPKAERLPEYYNGKWFIIDWIRNWVMVVTMDKDGHLQTIEPFMPHTTFHNISDMKLGPDGQLYEVEYGTGWFMKNDDSGLYVIKYNGGNRAPIAKINADKKDGELPLTVHFSAKGSHDPDGDHLTYSWDFGSGSVQQTEVPEVNHTFSKAGAYTVKLTVDDGNGGSDTQSLAITAGNEKPDVTVKVDGNPTFYFSDMPIKYNVSISDKEDGTLGQHGFDASRAFVKANYLEGATASAAVSAGQQEQLVNSLSGKALMETQDCQSCHKINEKSVGPSFEMVAKKYKGNADAINFLPKKIISGGSGIWGQTAMAAHPGLSVSDAKAIVSWILSLANESSQSKTLPLSGSINPRKRFQLTNDGVVSITATYKDKGGSGGAPSLIGSGSVVLRNPYLNGTDADTTNGMQQYKVANNTYMIPNSGASWLEYKHISLDDVRYITVHYGVQKKVARGWKVEARLDGPDGKLIGETVIGPHARPMKPTVATMRLNNRTGKELHDLYFVIQKRNAGEQSTAGLLGFELKAR